MLHLPVWVGQAGVLDRGLACLKMCQPTTTEITNTSKTAAAFVASCVVASWRKSSWGGPARILISGTIVPVVRATARNGSKARIRTPGASAPERSKPTATTIAFAPAHNASSHRSSFTTAAVATVAAPTSSEVPANHIRARPRNRPAFAPAVSRPDASLIESKFAPISGDLPIH